MPFRKNLFLFALLYFNLQKTEIRDNFAPAYFATECARECGITGITRYVNSVVLNLLEFWFASNFYLILDPVSTMVSTRSIYPRYLIRSVNV